MDQVAVRVEVRGQLHVAPGLARPRRRAGRVPERPAHTPGPRPGSWHSARPPPARYPPGPSAPRPPPNSSDASSVSASKRQVACVCHLPGDHRRMRQPNPDPSGVNTTCTRPLWSSASESGRRILTSRTSRTLKPGVTTGRQGQFQVTRGRQDRRARHAMVGQIRIVLHLRVQVGFVHDFATGQIQPPTQQRVDPDARRWQPSTSWIGCQDVIANPSMSSATDWQSVPRELGTVYSSPVNQ